MDTRRGLINHKVSKTVCSLPTTEPNNPAISLITKYPRLFVVSQQQNQTIQQLGDFKDNEWEWNLSWRRPLFDNEITMASNFLRDIERNTIQ